MQQLPAWIRTIDQEGVSDLIHRCNGCWQTEIRGAGEEIATDDGIGRGTQIKPVGPISAQQQIASQAVGIEQLISATTRLHPGASSGEDPIGKTGSLNDHIG